MTGIALLGTTRKGWMIRRMPQNRIVERDAMGTWILNRTMFHETLKAAFKDWIGKLRSGDHAGSRFTRGIPPDCSYLELPPRSRDPRAAGSLPDRPNWRLKLVSAILLDCFDRPSGRKDIRKPGCLYLHQWQTLTCDRHTPVPALLWTQGPRLRETNCIRHSGTPLRGWAYGCL